MSVHVLFNDLGVTDPGGLDEHRQDVLPLVERDPTDPPSTDGA